MTCQAAPTTPLPPALTPGVTVHYDKPVRELLADCVRDLRSPFTRQDVLAWFGQRCPRVKATTISTHLAGLTEGAQGAHAQYPPELDFVLPGLRSAVGVQAARAWTNNGALLAVLAAASAEGIDWLLLLVPTTYKGGPQHQHVLTQLRELSVARGVHLDLRGVGVLGY